MLVALATTARKAGASALASFGVAFLGPLAALFVSNAELTARTIVGCLLTGIIAALTTGGATYATTNTEQYVPRHAERTGSSAVSS